MTREQRRELVEELLRRGISLNRAAKMLGVSYGTAWNDAQVIKTDNLPARRIGADGKRYPASRPQVKPSVFVSTVVKALKRAGGENSPPATITGADGRRGWGSATSRQDRMLQVSKT